MKGYFESETDQNPTIEGSADRSTATTAAVRAPAGGLNWLHTAFSGPHGLQPALRRAIETLPKRPANAHDLAKHLQADSSMVWKLWEMAYAGSPEQAAAAMFGKVGLSRLLAKLVTRGADPAAADRAKATFARLEDAIARHAGDMGTLKMMIERGGENALTPQDKYAKLMFDAARYKLGLQTKAIVKTMVLEPSAFEGFIDRTTIWHVEQLCTLAPTPFHCLSHANPERMSDDNGKWRLRDGMRETLGSVQPGEIPEGMHELPVIEEMTRLNGRSIWREIHQGGEEVRVSGGPLGWEGAANICTGSRATAHHAQYQYLSESWMAFGNRISIPADFLILELYVHDQEVQSGFLPKARLYEMPSSGGPPRLYATGESLGQVEHYRPGLSRPDLPEVSGFQQLKAVAQASACNSLDLMHLFRWRVPYPVIGLDYVLVVGAVDD